MRNPPNKLRGLVECGALKTMPLPQEMAAYKKVQEFFNQSSGTSIYLDGDSCLQLAKATKCNGLLLFHLCEGASSKVEKQNLRRACLPYKKQVESQPLYFPDAMRDKLRQAIAMNL